MTVTPSVISALETRLVKELKDLKKDLKNSGLVDNSIIYLDVVLC